MAPERSKKSSVVKHRTKKAFGPGQDGSSSARRGSGARRGGVPAGKEGSGANMTALGQRSSNIKGKGKAGFKVGPSHAPDGAYLGRAKKIKADLIEKAKVKRTYHRKLAKEQAESGLDASMLENRDEGKFAPERIGDGDEDDDHDDFMARVAARAGPAPGEGPSGISQGKKRKRARDLGPSETKQKGKQSAVAEAESARKIKGGSTAGPDTVAKRKKEDAKSSILTAEERMKQRQDRDAKWNAESGSKRGRERGQPNLGNRVGLLLEKIKKG